MKKYMLFTLIGLLLFSLQAQDKSEVEAFDQLPLASQRKIIIEQLFQDTARYKKSDVYHSAIRTNNQNPYSQLYVINGSHLYKFDIVDRLCVEEFVSKYLATNQLISIEKMPQQQSSALYGQSGSNGAVIIQVKNLRRIKTENCGFVYQSRRFGHNLNQWKEGDLRIR